MSKQITTITKQLAARHKRKTKAEADLKKSRGEFFAYADEQLADESLAQKTVRTTRGLLHGMVEVGQRFPEWDLVESQEVEDDPTHETWDHLIREKPEFKSFRFVDPYLGLVFERQYRSGAIQLDDERLKEENPELFEKVTEEVRVPVDFDTLDEETLAEVQPYVFRGKPTVALAAPKKAKEEDLA
jgi:hypothetical protein